MQIKLDFSVSKNEAFRAFLEMKKADGYTAEKVNYTACATILKKGTHRISISPLGQGEIVGTEYEVDADKTTNVIPDLHRHPDDFREPRSFHRWKRLTSYLIVG